MPCVAFGKLFLHNFLHIFVKENKILRIFDFTNRHEFVENHYILFVYKFSSVDKTIYQKSDRKHILKNIQNKADFHICY